MFTRTLAALVGAAVLAATPAVAQDGTSLSVETADLNLSNADGRAELDRRIRQAATEVCEDRTPGHAALIAFQVCRFQARTAANLAAALLMERKSTVIQIARNGR